MSNNNSVGRGKKMVKHQGGGDKPVVVYFHRYPVEFEVVQYPGLRALLFELQKKYRVVYLSMLPAGGVDKVLREELGCEFLSIPLRIDVRDARDKWLKTFRYYRLLSGTLSRLKALDPVFIICKEQLPFVPLRVSKLRVPMIVDISDWWFSILLGDRPFGKPVAAFFERWEVSRWGRRKNLVAIGHSIAEGMMVVDRGMPSSRVKVINAPLNEGVFFPMDAGAVRKKIVGSSNKSFIVAMHGIIHPSKGYGVILDWWARLVKTRPHWKLVIIGGAGGEDWCKQKIKDLGISSNVVMSGWLPSQSDVNVWLNAADVNLVTRRNSPEGQGIIPSALYHALEVGKPTVITGLPGLKEIVRHGVDGFEFKPDSFESFKEVLESIEKDPKGSLKVASQGLKRAKECFDPRVAAVKWREVIDNNV